MSMSLSLLPTAAPIVARHLGAYVELAAAEATELARVLARRLLAAALALLGIVFMLLVGCVWLVGAVWETPWRDPTLASLTLLFAVLAVGGWVLAARRWETAAAPFSVLRKEWASDRRLFSEMAAAGPETAEPATSALERLRHTRDELQRLLSGGADQRKTDVFPRSRTMRLLLGAGGRYVAGTVAITALTGSMPTAVRWLLRVAPIGTVIQRLFRRRGR
jgi:uncharacterized membrane protein YqjE